MLDIQVGIVGEIVSGDEQGQFIKIVDDTENTGGYLILTSNNIEFRGGYDNWVEDKDALKHYFLECKWQINWSINKSVL